MMAVPLSGKDARGRCLWVSERDYHLFTANRWHVHEKRLPSGAINGPYARAWIGGGRQIFAHNLIMGCIGVDHVNGYGLDCTRRNLRKAGQPQNMRNRRKQLVASTSRFKGVDRHRQSGKWRARITVGGQTRELGQFPFTDAGELAARDAYDAASVKLHGAFARPNVPVPAGRND